MGPKSKPNTPLITFQKEIPPIKDFTGSDILFAEQFDRGNLAFIFKVTDAMKKIVEERREDDRLSGHLLATLFYEPSTRTRLSFEAAMTRLGGQYISESSVHYSSMAKGEQLPDTIRTVENLSADVIVLRHPIIGSAKTAADFAKIPIINAGDGPGQHPTQALLDLYTIKNELGRLDGLTVTMLGDLKYGRTVHSLAYLLSLYGVGINFVSPEHLRMPEELVRHLKETGIKITQTNRLEELKGDYDVLYMTRIQQERFENQGHYHLLKGSYDLNPEILKKTRAIIMHPFPRVTEIPFAIDSSPQACYFRQIQNGLYIRMALLAAVLGKV